MSGLPRFPRRQPVRTAGAFVLASLLACSGSTSPPAQVLHITLETGNGQTGLAGFAVNTPPTVRVRNSSNAAVAGVQVDFAVASGGGSVTGATATTNSSGVAQVGSWVVQLGANTLTATAAGTGVTGNPVTFTATGVNPAFHIDLRFLTTMSPARQEVFDSAAARWERLIFGDVPDLTVTAGEIPAGSCGDNSPAIAETIDDIIILVTLDSIDGKGSVLGGATNCFVRIPGFLPLLGLMHFDTADVADLEANGSFKTVILHEMGHVLGFGTLWGPTELNLLVGPSSTGGTDPHFVGTGAIGAFDAHGGASYSAGAKIPVENCIGFPAGVCGQGNRDSHWRETVFANELMTGFLNAGSNPLSVISTASMGDEGYLVNNAASDPYSVAHPLAGAAAPSGTASIVLLDDVIHLPLYGVDRNGRVTAVMRPR